LLEFSRSAVGIVKKSSDWIVFVLIPVLNSFTCFRMYRRNASLDQRLRSITVYTETPARYIAIAAPLLAECSPICSGLNPMSRGLMLEQLGTVVSIVAFQ
jgi:hypothetical protein